MWAISIPGSQVLGRVGKGVLVYLLGVKISRFVPLRVLKSKMTTVRIIPVPLRVLSCKM